MTFDQLLVDEDERQALISQLVTLVELISSTSLFPELNASLLVMGSRSKNLIAALLYTGEAHY